MLYCACAVRHAVFCVVCVKKAALSYHNLRSRCRANKLVLTLDSCLQKTFEYSLNREISNRVYGKLKLLEIHVYVFLKNMRT